MITCYKKPVQVDGKEKKGTYYYAAYTRKGTSDTLRLSKEMREQSSSFTIGEISGVTLDLPATIKRALLAGQAVRIDGLGTFKPALHTDEIKQNPDDLRTSAIRIAGIHFAPDAEMLASLNREAKFEWVNASKADKEDDGSGDDNGQQSQAPGNGQPTTPPAVD